MRRLSALAVVVSLALAAGACNGVGYQGGDPPGPTGPTPPAGGAVTIDVLGIAGNRSFGPNPATVPAGQTVVWRNTQDTGHRMVLDDGSAQTAVLAPGATSAPITIRGDVRYHCSIHPEMVGTIVAGP